MAATNRTGPISFAIKIDVANVSRLLTSRNESVYVDLRCGLRSSDVKLNGSTNVEFIGPYKCLLNGCYGSGTDLRRHHQEGLLLEVKRTQRVRYERRRWERA